MSPPACVKPDFPLARLTTIGTGGHARYLGRPRTVPELRELLGWAAEQGVETVIVGLGSNLLVADQGFDGLAVRLAGELSAVRAEGRLLRCGGGASLAVVVKRSQQLALAGVEFCCAIPGTVGGAVRMNAGAYGSELKDVLAEAVVVSADGERRGGAVELGMRYRHSNVAAGEVVAEARLALRAGDREQIRELVRSMHDRRRASQPQKVRTFGSVWQNPTAVLTAGRVLEQCELKGFAIGGARISPVHANFIENAGDASSADVLALMVEARRRARERFGVELQHEVQLVGPIALPD